jgi:hypothetical protein
METTQEVPPRPVESGLGPIGLFAIKTLIVSVAIVVSGWFVLDLLDDFATRRMEQLERTVRSATAVGGRQFWTRLELELDKLADPETDISSERKQKILAQIKVVSDRWRPFVLEAASTIAGDSNKSAK